MSGGDFILDSNGVAALVSDPWLREPRLESFAILSNLFFHIILL